MVYYDRTGGSKNKIRHMCIRVLLDKTVLRIEIMSNALITNRLGFLIAIWS